MKIDEVPTKVAVEEMGSRATKQDYIPLVEKIRELGESKGDTALIIKSEDKAKHNRVQGFVYGFNKRVGYKYIINQCSPELKIFVRLKIGEDKKKKGRSHKAA